MGRLLHAKGTREQGQKQCVADGGAAAFWARSPGVKKSEPIEGGNDGAPDGGSAAELVDGGGETAVLRTVALMVAVTVAVPVVTSLVLGDGADGNAADGGAVLAVEKSAMVLKAA
ncbi:hypothetical protein AB1Y20_017351 [Prymnesium parvum]|uniref:Uncharacterized protein n=1 Tax=Prymnesium parvum TaxID=97485 RepID=A0AB34JK99_PRYPA